LNPNVRFLTCIQFIDFLASLVAMSFVDIREINAEHIDEIAIITIE